jgi:ELWxxDGT repeat protein
VYFAAPAFVNPPGDLGRELWRADNSGSAQLIVDVIPGSQSSSPVPIGTVSGKLLLVVRAADPARGRELWVSDGTGAGTQPLSPLGTSSSLPVIVNGRAYFSKGPVGEPLEIWGTDGTGAGTLSLMNFSREPAGGGPWFEDSMASP